MLYFSCTRDNLLPVQTGNVRWLEIEADYPLAQLYWRGGNFDLTPNMWEKLQSPAYGYRYAAIILDSQIVSLAGVWRFSEDCWEVAAVNTLERYRRRGLSKRIIAFVTSYILKAGRLATCSTNDNNLAMIAAAKSVGFQQLVPGEVWWKYPQLPDL